MLLADLSSRAMPKFRSSADLLALPARVVVTCFSGEAGTERATFLWKGSQRPRSVPVHAWVCKPRSIPLLQLPLTWLLLSLQMGIFYFLSPRAMHLHDIFPIA